MHTTHGSSPVSTVLSANEAQQSFLPFFTTSHMYKLIKTITKFFTGYLAITNIQQRVNKKHTTRNYHKDLDMQTVRKMSSLTANGCPVTDDAALRSFDELFAPYWTNDVPPSACCRT